MAAIGRRGGGGAFATRPYSLPAQPSQFVEGRQARTKTRLLSSIHQIVSADICYEGELEWGRDERCTGRPAGGGWTLP